MLNREPDARGFQERRDAMERHAPWDAVLRSLYTTPEFPYLAGHVIRDLNAPHGASYLFGSDPPLDIGADGPGVSTESALRDALRPHGVAAPPGTTVLLARQATITISQTLDVPPGVTLATTGLPPPQAYAEMARLVRDDGGHEYGPVVALEPGAVLSHVWVDGGGDDPYAIPRTGDTGSVDVYLVPGAVGAQVVDGRADNGSAGGFTTILAGSASTGTACGAARRALVGRDLVTDYSSVHADGWWRDGISVACENTDVTGNAVVDASDAALIVYRRLIGPQTSVVRDNVVVNAGTQPSPASPPTLSPPPCRRARTATPRTSPAPSSATTCCGRRTGPSSTSGALRGHPRLLLPGPELVHRARSRVRRQHHREPERAGRRGDRGQRDARRHHRRELRR